RVPPAIPLGNAVRRVQVFEGEAIGDGEEASAFADKENVRRLLHDQAGECGDMANVLDAGDGPAAQGSALHDRGVELDRARPIADAAEADRADERIVLD